MVLFGLMKLRLTLFRKNTRSLLIAKNTWEFMPLRIPIDRTLYQLHKRIGKK